MAPSIEQIRSLRQERKFREASALAKDLIATNERNSDAWWNLALAQIAVNDLDEAILSLRTLLKLAPKFASGWAQYGHALGLKGQDEQGLKALSQALLLDPNDSFAARQAARICNKINDLKHEMHYISRLEAMGEANADDFLQIGNTLFYKKHFRQAIDYYRRSASEKESCAAYFNLSLVYSHSEISQDVDAVDCLERALLINPSHDKAKTRLDQVKERLITLSRDVLYEGTQGLGSEDWYQFYVNPFEILRADRNDDFEGYDAKKIQKLKKLLVQEIELEDGKIAYLEGLRLDKSKAITLCEELNNEDLKRYHWLVFTEPRLLNFLSRGEIEHFLCGNDYNPINLLDELDAEWSGFRDWLSSPFASQYDLVLTRAIRNKRLPLIESLFDGRRWVTQKDEERCFKGARRQIGQLLEPLRDAATKAKDSLPSITLLENLITGGHVTSILNLLPDSFRDNQYEAVTLIREIALTSFNEHGNIDLSKSILTLSKSFSFKSASLTQQLSDDFETIDLLIAEERRHEAKLTLGSDKLEVTKYGVRQGSTFIPADNVASIRWGVVISGTQYRQSHQFLMVCRDNSGLETTFSWTTSADFERQRDFFNSLLNAAFTYIVPKIFEKTRAKLDGANKIKIGPCSLGKTSLMFVKEGWFNSKQVVIPWNRVGTRINNGVLTVFDRGNPKMQVEMELRTTENAVILQLLADNR